MLRNVSSWLWLRRLDGTLLLGERRERSSAPSSAYRLLTAESASACGTRGQTQIQLEMDNVNATAAVLRQLGADLHNDVVIRFGDKQIFLEDPSGNPIELSQPG